MPLTGLNRNIQETLTPWRCWSPDAAGEALRKKLTPEQIPTQMHQTKAMDLRLFTAFRELWEASSRIFNSNGFTDKGLPKKNTRNPKGRGFQGSFASLGYQQEPQGSLCSSARHLLSDTETWKMAATSCSLGGREWLHQVSAHKTFLEATTTTKSVLFNIPFGALKAQQWAVLAVVAERGNSVPSELPASPYPVKKIYHPKPR